MKFPWEAPNVGCADATPLRSPISREHVTWLSIAIVLFNTLATLALPLGTYPHGINAGRTIDRIVICTVDGLREYGPENAPASNNADAHSGVCIDCLPLLTAALIAPGTILWSGQPPSTQTIFPERLAPRKLIRHRPTARGPPLA